MNATPGTKRRDRKVGLVLMAFAVLALVGIAVKFIFFPDNRYTPPPPPSVIWDSPTDGQEISGSQGAHISGTVNDIGEDSVWIFDVAAGPKGNVDRPVYYLASEGAIATSGTRFSTDDKPIGGSGDTDVGTTFTIALVRASPSCSTVLQSAKPNDQGGGIIFQSLPEGCRELATRQVKKVRP